MSEVSLSVAASSIHGLLGPNGAGKTTLVKILSTVLIPTAGDAYILGHNVVTEVSLVRSLIGVAYGGERGLYYRLTGRQNIEYWATLYNVPKKAVKSRSEALLDRVGLLGKADSLVETYSRGMKQRLHLARALVHEPRVVLLDEPTSGMDPVGARDFRALIAALRSEGRTMLLTTHDMAEAEALCDEVTMIGRGQILATESPRELAQHVSRFEQLDAADVPEPLVNWIYTQAGVRSVKRLDKKRIRVEIDAYGALRSVLQQLVNAGVTSIQTSTPNLEDVYLQLFDSTTPSPR